MPEPGADGEGHRLLPDVAGWDYRRIIPSLGQPESCECAAGAEGSAASWTPSDALRLRGEVHALEEGLEAGVGAEGV